MYSSLARMGIWGLGFIRRISTSGVWPIRSRRVDGFMGSKVTYCVLTRPDGYGVRDPSRSGNSMVNSACTARATC